MRLQHKQRASNKKASHRRPKQLTPEEIFHNCASDETHESEDHGFCCYICFLQVVRQLRQEGDEKVQQMVDAFKGRL